MKVHLKNYPCNSKNIKGEPYTVNRADVTCEKCLNAGNAKKPAANKRKADKPATRKAPAVAKDTTKDNK